MFFRGSYNSSLFAELPKVRWVLPDSYLDVRNKDYGGNDNMFPILVCSISSGPTILLIYSRAVVYFAFSLLIIVLLLVGLLLKYKYTVVGF
jgi:hypothetical protein